MKTIMIRCCAVSCLSVVLLAGCSSKKLEAKVKKLEKEIEELQISHDEAIARKDQTIHEKVAAFDEASGKSHDKISELSGECDRLKDEVRDLQLKLGRQQADADASKATAGSPAGEGPDLTKDPKFSDAMVSIVGDVSKSTGVVVEDGGKRYIYTSGDTLGGNTRLVITSAGGTKFTKFGSLQTADGCALVRIELLEETAPAIALAPANFNVASQNSLQCLSLSPGAGGSVAGAKVMVYNQTDESIGCDINTLIGKAGAAIVDPSSGKVVAVVVNQTEEVSSLWAPAVDPARDRVLALRVNRSISWQPVAIKAFLDESRRIRDFNRMTRVVHAFGGMTPGADGLGISGAVGEGGTVRSVLTAAADVPIAAEAVALDAQLAQKKVRLGEADLKRRLKGLFSSVASQSKAGLTGFTPDSFSQFHRKSAEQSLKWRTEADRVLNTTEETIESLNIAKPVDRGLPQNFNRR